MTAHFQGALVRMQVCKAARAFDPSFAESSLTETHVDSLVSTIRPLMEHTNLHLLKRQLPAYLVASKDVEIDRTEVSKFSEQVLTFWRKTSKKELSEWRKAATIVFSMSPNSASCERVFSLLANMYGDQQHNVLSDHLQASIMMRFNGRSATD